MRLPDRGRCVHSGLRCHPMKFVVILLCLLAYVFGRSAISRAIGELSHHRGISPARIAFITRTLNIILFTALFGVGTIAAGLGYGEVSLFVSSFFAVMGIALFAQWSILSNLTASLIIFFAFPYRVGDPVKVVDKDEDISGRIEKIDSFHVLIRRANGDLITYPNSLILQKAVIRLDQTAAPPPPSSAEG